MSYGILTYNPGRPPSLTPNSAGGVFHTTVVFGTTTQRYTFSDLLGYTIFGITTKGGYHQWVTGIDGNGHPYVEAPGFPIPSWRSWNPGEFDTYVSVFAR